MGGFTNSRSTGTAAPGKASGEAVAPGLSVVSEPYPYPNSWVASGCGSRRISICRSGMFTIQ